jgi:hypothetical protein
MVIDLRRGQGQIESAAHWRPLFAAAMASDAFVYR